MGEAPRTFSGPRGYARARRLGHFQVLPSTFSGPIGLCHGQASRTLSAPRLCHMTTLYPRLNVFVSSNNATSRMMIRGYYLQSLLSLLQPHRTAS